MTLNVPIENYKLLMSAALALQKITETAEPQGNFSFVKTVDINEAKKIVSDLKGIIWK